MRFARLLTIGLAVPLMGIACEAPTEPLETLVAVEVGPTIVICLTTSPGGGYGYAACMDIRELPDGAWFTQNRAIDGFEFKPGVRSRLLVSRPRDLPTDGSDRVYRLRKVVDRVRVAEP